MPMIVQTYLGKIKNESGATPNSFL